MLTLCTWSTKRSYILKQTFCSFYSELLRIGTLSIVSAFWGTSTLSSVFGFSIPPPFKWYPFHTFTSDYCMRSEVSFGSPTEGSEP